MFTQVAVKGLKEREDALPCETWPRQLVGRVILCLPKGSNPVWNVGVYLVGLLTLLMRLHSLSDSDWPPGQAAGIWGGGGVD